MDPLPLEVMLLPLVVMWHVSLPMPDPPLWKRTRAGTKPRGDKGGIERYTEIKRDAEGEVEV